MTTCVHVFTYQKQSSVNILPLNRGTFTLQESERERENDIYLWDIFVAIAYEV